MRADGSSGQAGGVGGGGAVRADGVSGQARGRDTSL